MRRFEFVEGKSSKFWQLEQVDSDLHIQWGRIGTSGQSQIKSFADQAKAQSALLKLIVEKTGKGYVEVGSAPAASATPAPAPATPASQAPSAASPSIHTAPEPPSEPQPTTVDATPPPTETVAPWLAAGDPVQIPANLRKLILPSRGCPQPLEALDAEALWRELREPLTALPELSLERSAPSLHEHIEQASRRLEQTEIVEESRESDAVLLQLALATTDRHWNEERKLAARFVQYLVARRGLVEAVEVLLLAQHWQLHMDRYSARGSWLVLEVDGRLANLRDFPRPGEWILRHYLAAAPEAEWQACVQRIRVALPALHPERQIDLAVLVPDAPELAAEVLERIEQIPEQTRPNPSYLLLNLRDPALVERVLAMPEAQQKHGRFWQSATLTLSALDELGSAAEPLLLACPLEEARQALACLGTPAAMATLAQFVQPPGHWDKEQRIRFNEAIGSWPLAAIAGLAELLAEQGKAAQHLRPYLTSLLRGHQEDLTRLLPWLSPDAAQLLQGESNRLALSVEEAEADELPPVLVSPPWLQSRTSKAAAPVAVEPLSLPAEEHWPAGEREALLQPFEPLDARAIAEQLYLDDGALDQAARAIQALDAAGLLEAWDRSCAAKGQKRYHYVALRGEAILHLPEELAVALWNHALEHMGSVDSFWLDDSEAVLARLGLRALPGLLALLARRPAGAIALARPFAAAELAQPMARALTKLKAQRGNARRWLLAYPEHAACALIAPAVGKRGEARNQAAGALRLLANQGHEALILEVAARYDDAKVLEAVRAMLAEDPLDQFPAKRSALPHFWQPHRWTRPRLRDSDKVLPAGVLDPLGQMMSFPVVDGLYAGLEQVREACTRQSLAEFAWDCYSAWDDHGAPSKDNWAFSMLGYLGDDDTARRLAPLIRNWPSEGAFARAVAGLEVLNNIGSDVSLMLLNGIAQKVKSKGLQDRANEKIQAIAEARGLDREELEDRLVPSLGLDARGTLELDFGPRRFTVGFDELLRPYVRDPDGARLANLPKPRQSDDAELSKAATELFRNLKKDVKTIGGDQVRRLESAMCSRRRWLPEAFRQCLAEHPLLRHLVQRLVWGVYAVEGVEDEQSGHGGRLLQCFRIAEDGSATDAGDDPLELPEGGNLRYGLPHPLELTPEQAAAFAELFADYQLMQPFAQLGRDTYQLSETERAGGRLERWNGVKVDTGRLFSLAHRGWQRGAPQDAGVYYEYSKPFDDRRQALLIFEPGIQVSEPSSLGEQQTLQTLHFGRPSNDYHNPVSEQPLATLDPIAASELIRDMEHLCA